MTTPSACATSNAFRVRHICWLMLFACMLPLIAGCEDKAATRSVKLGLPRIPSGYGLQTGSTVIMDGIVVGQISRIYVDELQTINAELAIQEDLFEFIRDDSMVTVRSHGSIESTYLSITRGQGERITDSGFLLRVQIEASNTPAGSDQLQRDIRDIRELIHQALQPRTTDDGSNEPGDIANLIGDVLASDSQAAGQSEEPVTSAADLKQMEESLADINRVLIAIRDQQAEFGMLALVKDDPKDSKSPTTPNLTNNNATNTVRSDNSDALNAALLRLNETTSRMANNLESLSDQLGATSQESVPTATPTAETVRIERQGRQPQSPTYPQPQPRVVERIVVPATPTTSPKRSLDYERTRIAPEVIGGGS